MEKEQFDKVMKKLDEILEYLKTTRKKEIDEKLEMMLKCTCGSFNPEEFEDEDEGCECCHCK